MSLALFLLILLAAVVASGVLAKRLSLPYPIVFLLGGVALAFVPDLPKFRLDPQWIFLIVLPPLLVFGGWTTDWFSFKRNLRSITLLAVGLVLFTTLGVAWLGVTFVGLSWPMAFALGAIVAPPDAVAAEAIFERFSIPRRIVTILTGEGLVNDATALVLYRFAVAAAVTGAFSLHSAALSFIAVAVGGVAVGLLCALATELLLRFLRARELDDSMIVTVVLLIVPYAAYLPAELLHVSGVLAAVAAGMYLSRRATTILDSESRIIGAAVWNVMTFLLNAFVFMTIGLQLRPIFSSLGESLPSFLVDALVICVAVIVLRLAWVFAAGYLQTLFTRNGSDESGPFSWKGMLLVGYAGMRGIVSLAAALALPYTASDGTPLHGRAEIIVITVAVILVTLVGQGLTLGPLIEKLGISESSEAQKQGTSVRIKALKAGLSRLHELESGFDSAVEWETAGRLFREYEDRIEHLLGHLRNDEESEDRLESSVDHKLQNAALQAERQEIRRLRAAGEIPDAVFREIEYDLDLADLRLS